MRATMKIPHRAARFGHHQLYVSDVIYTEEGEEGAQRVSKGELLHHLEHGHADPIKGPPPEVARPDELVEVATPASEPEKPKPPRKPARKAARKK